MRYAIEKYNKKILFLLLLFDANISEENQTKINDNPELANCLAEFKKIKVIPFFGRLMEAHKGGNIKAILPLINNEKALIKDLQKIKERCSSNEQCTILWNI